MFLRARVVFNRENEFLRKISHKTAAAINKFDEYDDAMLLPLIFS